MLVQFRELMLRQMSSTASDQLAAKFKTRKVEESNAKLIADIKGKFHLYKALTNALWLPDTIGLQNRSQRATRL